MKKAWGDERGISEAVEAAMLLPLVLLLVGATMVGGRIFLAHQRVNHAAEQAARSASLARDPQTARLAARDMADATLNNQGMACLSRQVDVDVSGFAVAVGQPAWVTATVTCTINLADLPVPGLPRTMTIVGTLRSPLDTYRGR